jgi:hypothetical protein
MPHAITPQQGFIAGDSSVSRTRRAIAYLTPLALAVDVFLLSIALNVLWLHDFLWRRQYDAIDRAPSLTYEAWAFVARHSFAIPTILFAVIFLTYYFRRVYRRFLARNRCDSWFVGVVGVIALAFVILTAVQFFFFVRSYDGGCLLMPPGTVGCGPPSTLFDFFR